MASFRKLAWYVSRLARMTPAEMLHRAREQKKRLGDARRAWSWDRFGRFESPAYGLPGREVWSDFAGGNINELASRAGQGQFCLLSQQWPDIGRSWTNAIWHLDPITETHWPGKETFAFDVGYREAGAKGDVKFVWELNRLGFLQWLAADASNDDEKWAFIAKVLRGWMDANPPFRGINWTSGIEAASRLASLFAVLAFANDERRAELVPLTKPFVEAHCFWIDRYPSLYSSANNHRVAELSALFLSALCVPNLPEAKRYLLESRRGLEREILLQIYVDGVGAEQSPTYAAYSLEWFALVGLAADRHGHPMSDSYRKRAASAVSHLSWMMDGSGSVPHIGDDDEGRVLNFCGPAYVPSVVGLCERWLELEPECPTGTRMFADGGYSIIREQTERGLLMIAFDHGPLGFLSIAAHGHADALSVWLHWGEEPVLVDAGTYLYHSGGVQRDSFRGTRAHNTVAINATDQSRIAGAFSWSRHAHVRVIEASESVVTAEHDGYFRTFGVRHRRSIRRLSSRNIQIEDQIIGGSGRRPLSWTLGFLVDPAVSVEAFGPVAWLQTPKGRRLSLRLDASSSAAWKVEERDYSPAFNQISPSVRLETSGTVPRNAIRTITTQVVAE